MAPLRPAYLAELAKIHEPPEMAGKPMQVRKAVPGASKIMDAMNGIRDPDKMTHEQREASVRKLLAFADDGDGQGTIPRGLTFGVVATLACFDGSDPKTVIGYTNSSIDDHSDGNSGRYDSIALRSRMYLRAGDREKALKDLEEILAAAEGNSLVGGGVDPRKESNKCGWSIADFDALGDDPRALAAKGLYLSTFLNFGAGDRGTVKEAEIRELFKRAEKSWKSAIPYLLDVHLDSGLGSQHTRDQYNCVRTGDVGPPVPSLVAVCGNYDEGTERQIRTLTMALVTDPKSASAMSARAGKYLQLARASYDDGKPSVKLYQLAIDDYAAALVAGGKDKDQVGNLPAGIAGLRHRGA